MSGQRDLPLSMVTLVFGVLSIPLAFARHLCVPATIMGLLAIGFHLWGARAAAATHRPACAGRCGASAWRWPAPPAR